MAKSFPNVGEAYLGANPYALKVQVIRVSSASTDDVVLTTALTGSDAEIAMPAGMLVHDLGWFVETAFSAGSAITIGDSDAVAGFAAATDVAATTADTEVAWASRVNLVSSDHLQSDCPVYGKSRLFGTSHNLAFAMTNTGAGNSAGALCVLLAYSMVGNEITQA